MSEQLASLGRRAVYDHLAFLLASADLCQHEPAYYGTLRLLDGASRFTKSLLESGYEDAELVRILERIEEAKRIRKLDAGAYSTLLHELPAAIGEVIRSIAEDATA